MSRAHRTSVSSAVLQWGLGLSTEERRLHEFASSSWPIRLQWGLGLSTEESPYRVPRASCTRCASMGPRSFNRGKTTVHLSIPGSAHASMGPRSFNRGKIVSEFNAFTSYNASMGPRSFNRGKWFLLLGVDQTKNASMGPRSFNRGKCGAPAHKRVLDRSFNGASVFQPRKGSRRRCTPEKVRCFNGASVFQPRKGERARGGMAPT